MVRTAPVPRQHHYAAMVGLLMASLVVLYVLVVLAGSLAQVITT